MAALRFNCSSADAVALLIQLVIWIDIVLARLEQAIHEPCKLHPAGCLLSHHALWHSPHKVPGATVLPGQADFTRPLGLPPLDGVLLANALHLVRAQAVVIAQAADYLRAGGRVLLVAYDLHHGQRCLPFPVPLPRFRELAATMGLAAPDLIGAHAGCRRQASCCPLPAPGRCKPSMCWLSMPRTA